jgi:hypothetical protein
VGKNGYDGAIAGLDRPETNTVRRGQPKRLRIQVRGRTASVYERWRSVARQPGAGPDPEREEGCYEHARQQKSRWD